MKSVAKKDDAVSPVIGTILLVAITVVLVAIVAAVVMGMVGGVGQSKTVGVTVTPFANESTGFTLTITGGADAGSVSNITAYMEGVTFADSGVIVAPKVGKPVFVKTTDALTAAKTGALTLTGTFTDGSQYVIYQNQITIPKAST